MTILEVEKKLTKIAIDKLGVDETEALPNARFVDDLGADSLDAVELLMEAEAAFDISIPDDVAEKMHSIAEGIEAYITHYPRKAFNLIDTRILFFQFLDFQ